MRVNILLILMLIVSSCGKIKVQHEVKGNVQGDINHTVKFTLDEITNVFYQQCLQENPTFTEEQLIECRNQKLEDFLNIINDGSQNDDSTT